ncbi:putative alpha-1,2-mannosidase [Pseudovirgaria hyperparasitica]|uniref:Putative alpha-1,2-mannosidase n=1 Tax=Pseudovirgaria hyperparasitica TaxID=470096 RepID=A0A6A6W4V5_9PEZI|nr:putative alpha-1,2-mannosidase [Pseudovirgaria hyperparasitica]KAF2757209.1 putative alpha-1,2-mannosidase [Pseudovirgaria hyperparasitica]
MWKHVVLFALATGTSCHVLDYIDPLIGSNGGGNVFAGATLPYGMAKAVADVDGQNTGGFSTDNSNVTGFSSMHDAGTGGNPSLGNFPLFPQFCPGNDLNNCRFPKDSRKLPYKNDTVVARPGYFALTLDNNISAEMTTTKHAALYQFSFPDAKAENGTTLHPLILVDLDDLWLSRQNASVSVDAATGRISGNGTFLPSFGAGSYVLHFCVDFAGASIFDSGMYVNDRAGTEPKELYVTRGFNLFYIQAGSFVRFHRPSDGTISARFGVSYISSDKACQNAEHEIPDWDFDVIRARAEDAWIEKLDHISITPGGASEDLQNTFYSGLYRNMINPQDYTGENPQWESDEPYFDSFYCIWDAFRAQHPMLTIIDPNEQSRMVRSLLDTYKHRGWLPDCQMSLSRGWTQGGSNADVVLVDAYVKNLTGIDWSLAYEAVIKDAEVEPLDWSNQGRGGLQSWKRLNYIPYLDYDYLGFGTNSRSISRTVEYAYNDFVIATLSIGLGKDPSVYLQRASNWRNLYKSDQTSFINGTDTGFVGFFQPKYLNGTWGYQDPIACSPLATFCSLTSNPSETFESSVWEYQFYVPQDMAALIDTLGGAETLIKRLDYAFESGLLDISNEPVFLTVYAYHYAGRPALSTKRVHTYIPSRFNSSYTGLPGNDDSGAMGSFSAFSMMGLFPNAGQNVYLISAPFFESWSINMGNDTVATVKTVNFDPAYKNIYIQSVTLNGGQYKKSWIGHEFFAQGWTLEITLGDAESDWGTKDEDLPPSMSTSQIGHMSL